MFGTIRRHSKWMWFIIVAVIIVSFVVYFDPSVQQGARGDSGQLGEINGKPITPRQYRETEREVRLIYFLNNRQWPEQDETALQRGFDLERQTFGRLLQIAEVEQAGIQVADTVVAEAARRMLGNDLSLDRFAAEILGPPPGGLTVDDFERFLRHDLAIQQLAALNGLPGRLVPPAEAEAIYRRENQALAGEIVLFGVTNYMTRVAITNGALTNFFLPQMARYRTPERLTVSYVEFTRTNTLPQAEEQMATVTNLNALLEQRYYEAGTNAFRDTNGNVLPREQAIGQIKENELGKLAMFFARRKANDFASKVYDEASKQGDEAPVRPGLLAGVAASEGLPVQVTPPFSIQEGPTNLNLAGVSPRLWMSLSETNAVVFQPIEGENGYYVIAFKEMEPSRLQTFDEVKDQVAEDYRRSQAFSLIRTDATNFQARLTNGLAAGKTFSEIASELDLTPVTLPPISRTTQTVPDVDVNVDQLRRVMFSLEPGKASPVIPGQDGAYLVYVRAKLPFDEEKMKAELPRFMAELRYEKQSDVFNQWFRRRVEKAQPGIPALNQPPRPRDGVPPGFPPG